jgi:hypothetical protein
LVGLTVIISLTITSLMFMEFSLNEILISFL